MNLTKKEQLAFDLYEKHRSQRKAATEMGVSRRTFRRYFDTAKAKLNNAPVGFKTTKITTDGNGKITAMQHKLAPEIDGPRDGKIVKTSTLYGADGSVVGEWVMRKPEEVERNDYMEALDKHFVTDVTREPRSEFKINLTTIPTCALFLSVDEHIGVRLTQEQMGQDYGLDDAINLMEESFYELLDRTPDAHAAYYVNLGDQFHANDHMDVTPASKNPLHSSTTFNTVSDAVVSLNRRRIDALRTKYPELIIRGVAGNHDYDPMGWLFRCYGIAYENCEDVDVEFWADELGCEQFGQTLLCFNHGDKMKPDTLAGNCADRFPVQYGSSVYRYIHTGHYHHDKELDVMAGFKWHSHRTMAPKDWYSKRHGYSSRQTMKSFVYHYEEGEIGRFSKSFC